MIFEFKLPYQPRQEKPILPHSVVIQLGAQSVYAASMERIWNLSPSGWQALKLSVFILRNNHNDGLALSDTSDAKLATRFSLGWW